MIKGRFIDKNLIKSTIIYFVLFLIVILGIVVYTKYWPKNSFGANNEKVYIQGNIEKYINFEISENNKGTLLQYNIKTWVEREKDENQYIPIKQSQIKLEFNQINGKYPYSIKLVPVSTEATNGMKEDIKEQYRYDSETGILLINTSNLGENGELINTDNLNDKKDEYIVICNYDTFSKEAEEREIDIKATSIAVMSEDDRLISTQDELKQNVKENIGELISIENITQEIYNGNIKSNIINETEYSTQYCETQKIMVSKKDAQNRIYLTEDNEFVKIEKTLDDNEIKTDLGNNNELVYKNTKIKKENIIKILGENGKLEILDNNKNVLATIDKNSEFDENNSITINYENDLKSIIIRTTEIQNEGILEIENTKEIKSTMKNIINTKIKTVDRLFDITENADQDQNTNTENVRESEITNKEDILILKNEKENIIDIKDSTTNIDLSINKTDWTNKEQNEVLFDINLNSNSTKDNMFKNPKIEIQLPIEVEKVILGDSSLTYGNGLELKDVTVQKNSEDKFVIIADINGNQTTYNENTLGLKTNIHIPATIILKKDIESLNNSINLTCNNNYTLDGNTEIINKQYEIQIQSYKDENINAPESSGLQNGLSTTRNLQVAPSAVPSEQIEGLKLEVVPVKGDTVLKDGDTVYEGEFIKYNIKVTNTSDKTINNVKIVGTIPEGTTYGELEADYHTSRIMYEEKNNKKLEDELYKYNYDENVKEKVIDIGSLLANDFKEVFYEVRVQDLGENEEKETFTKVEVNSGESVVSSYQINNLIKDAEAKVYVSSYIDCDKNDWNYKVTIESPNEVNLNFKLPKEYEFVGIVNSDQETNISEDNVLTVRLDSGEYIFKGKIDGKKIENQTEVSKLELKAYATIEYNNIKYKSNENRILYEYENVSIEITSDKEGEEIEYGGEINYQIKIKNIGSTNIKDVTTVNLKDYLPREIKPIKITYENYEKEIVGYDEENKIHILSDEYKKIEKEIDTSSRYVDTTKPDIDIDLNIPENETLTVKINAVADIVLEKTKIENRATVSGDFIITKTSNIVSHVLLPLDYYETIPQNPDNPSNSDNPEDLNEKEHKNSVSGVAWLDINQDGQRQEGEPLLNGINVMLVDADNATSIKDKTITDSNGLYRFENLKKGKYIIIFIYDTNKYALTEYKKAGVNLLINSDAMNEEITLSGKKEKVGLTEILSVDASIKNIDIGLIKNKVCDLKLDKYISKVTVETARGTTEQSYEKSSLAKVEIKAKEIQGAKVLVEYKLVITNEGEIPTSVNKVIDYIPEGLEFSPELNKNWNINKKGELTNESLSNTKIDPGKNIELTLILNKIMTNNSTGTIINEAEIGEISNSLKINDTDSIPDNKIKTEDDYSKAELIISVSTGALLYIYILITFLFILGLFSYYITKFGFKKINKITILILIIFLGIFYKVNETNATINQNDYYGPVEFIVIEGSDPTTFYGTINGKRVEGICNIQGGNYGGKNGRKYYKYKWIETPLQGSPPSSESITLEKKNNSDDEIKINKISNNYIIGPFKIRGDNENNYNFNIYISGKTNPETGKVCDINGNDMILSTSTSTTTTFYLKLGSTKISEGQRIQNIKCIASKNVSSTTKVIKKVIASYRPEVLDGNGTTTYDGQIWPTYNGIKYQGVKVQMQIEDTDSSNEPKSKEIVWEIRYGNLEITKVDTHDQNIVLPGVEIRVYCNETNYDQTFITDNDGKIQIRDLRQGTYTIEEKTNNHYGYTEKVTKTVRVNPGMNNKYSLENPKKTGNLVIIKKDADSGKVLEGVSFRIKREESGYVQIKNKQNEKIDKITGQVHVDGNTIQYVSNEQDATEFITNSDGRIELNNILNGNYDIEEISVGNNRYYDVDDNYVSWKHIAYPNDGDTTVDMSEGTGIKATSIWVYARRSFDTLEVPRTENRDNVVTFYNKKKYINLSGYVWVDDYFDKQTQKDNLFNNREEPLNGITVKLMKNGVKEPIMTTTTSSLNRYQEKNNPDGEYIFEKVPLYDVNDTTKDINNTILDQYYIEFEYNGVVYQNVVPNVNLDNGSKAAENKSIRTEYNNKFEFIEGKGSENQDEGIARSFSSSTINLYYNEVADYNNNGRKMVWDSSKLVEKIYARTNETEYNLKSKFIINNGDYPEEIRNINLGLYRREQPDLSIVSDIESARINIKGYEYKYVKNNKTTNSKYNQDKADYDQKEEEKNIADNLKYQFDLTSSFGLKYGPEEYTGQLYASDIGYSKNAQNDDKLNLYVTYRIRLLNTATNLYSRVNEIVSYFDNRYESIESISESDGTTYIEDVDYKLDRTYNKDGYKKVIITKPQDINKESEKYFNITFKLSDEAIQAVLQNDIMLNEVTEITSYSTYSDQFNTVYAGIDKDSNPGNVNIIDKKTYEDDTDFAPSFKITIREREISGTVWEDDVISNDLNGVKGNGKYDANENVLQNVNAELLEITGFDETGKPKYEKAKLYKYDENSNTVSEKSNIIQTSSKGEYLFSGVLPGKYIIRYTYGNSDDIKSIVCDVNGNKLKEIDPYDYKSTIFRGGKKEEVGLDWYTKETSAYENVERFSDARDDDKIIEARINNNTKMYYKVAVNQKNDQKEIYANTNNFEIGIEYDGIEVKKEEAEKRLIRICFDQVDFGIIRRAEQKLKISKNIIWVELTLANGQTIISGNPQTDEIKYLKILPDGNVSIELDNELVQGASLNVKYEIKADANESEVDFLDRDYYIYGKKPEDETKKMAKINIKKLYDYPSDDFVYSLNNDLNQDQDWQIVEISQDQKGEYFSEEAFDKIKNLKTVLCTNKFDEIEPNNDKKVTLQLSKILANNDDISLDNGVEINVLEGRKFNFIPGNYIPGKINQVKEDDSDNAYLSITSPTGKTYNTKEIIILSISMLIILGTGVIFIKKKIVK